MILIQAGICRMTLPLNENILAYYLTPNHGAIQKH